ncbi:MAG TPA: DUF1499 domain-containing protein [Thermodesulfovibrionales bacterium]|nr:DUF1499 domain-containing protein [Thermodesulfovibrionales bacterium]
MKPIREEDRSRRSLPGFTSVGFALCIAVAFAAALSGFGSRWDFWHFRTGFTILTFASLGGIVSSLLCFAGLVISFRRNMWRSFILCCAGLALGLTIFGIPFSWYLAARQLPKIHDITTDTENPPEFAAVILLRRNAPNPPEYGGPDVASKQREAYPDMKPLVLDVPAGKAFDKARTAARRMGWEIVSANKQDLRIEATDTTAWFGFKDDVVIRITPLDDSSRVDIRSVSRVGLGDVGTNAQRIRRYLKRLSKSE